MLPFAHRAEYMMFLINDSTLHLQAGMDNLDELAWSVPIKAASSCSSDFNILQS